MDSAYSQTEKPYYYYSLCSKRRICGMDVVNIIIGDLLIFIK